MSAIDRLVSRLDDQRRTDAAALAATPCTACSAEERLGLAFVPGDRVVDLVTGRKGTIRAGATETTLVPTTRG